MSWEAVGAIGETVGAMAVVLTLIYLSVQLRQNTTAIQAERREGHFQNLVGWYQQMKDPQTADTWFIGVRDYQSLNVSQKFQFHSMAMQLLLNYEQARTLNKQGLYTTKDLEPEEFWVITFINTPGGRAWWQDSAGDWNPELKTHLAGAKVPDDYQPSLMIRVQEDVSE